MLDIVACRWDQQKRQSGAAEAPIVFIYGNLGTTVCELTYFASELLDTAQSISHRQVCQHGIRDAGHISALQCMIKEDVAFGFCTCTEDHGDINSLRSAFAAENPSQ
ncbi:hypothetical protein TSTA_076930 [Talaromyces stipitatus ATCC 10500]|uniref:Uncharacterized protein n=1 Tax=Talaromyces stipitatus (strain ATCC 10500 / CBS 375.48 / QM 6759 / NRRL 1006) TaxID=441959 RepID=B8LVW0_TALSN|nr:uncharacterized protein TSTA_076930 [Talaromyces stipitatus ATCC 10500]EED24326.1 hypothetical protein TSTA_076930 [Talaromyces stipitatus ATCC 10500]